jgi:cell division protein FtsN
MMKDNNKYVDDKLRELADFKPKVEPDWDAFYLKNQEEIAILGNGAGKTFNKIASSATLKNTIIILSVITVFVVGICFITYNSNKTAPATKTNEIEVYKSKEEVIPVAPSNENQNNQLPINEMISPATIEKVTGKTEIQQSEKPALIIEEQNLTNIPGENVMENSTKQDSLTEKPVIIRKTVIIKDTISIKRPGSR